jgi:hypothetical protein
MRTMLIAAVALMLGTSGALVQAQEPRPMLEIFTSPAAGAQSAPKRVQGFSVLLLLGEMQSAALPDNVSAPARKALADIKDFLPYKSFRVLDTLWLAGSDFGNSSGRLRGIEDPADRERQNYDFELRTFPLVPSAKAGTAEAALSRAQFKLLPAFRAGEQRTTVLDSSFNITAGETVVVGTSRVQGDRALVVLLTAVAAGK